MRIAGWLAASCVLAACATAAAQAANPIAFLQSHDARVRQVVLASPDTLSPADRARVQALINDAFDFTELSRLSLGEQWERCTQQERGEFVRVLRGIIERRNFDVFLRYYREGRIAYTGEEVGADGRAVVRAQVPLKKETKEIAYFLHRPGTSGAWQIYDLAIDGSGTAEGNRRTYARFLAKHTFAELLERLRSQLNQLGDA